MANDWTKCLCRIIPQCSSNQRCQFNTEKSHSRMQLSYKKGQVPSWRWWTLDNCKHWPSDPHEFEKPFEEIQKNLIDERNVTIMSELPKCYITINLTVCLSINYDIDTAGYQTYHLKKWIGNILGISSFLASTQHSSWDNLCRTNWPMWICSSVHDSPRWICFR